MTDMRRFALFGIFLLGATTFVNAQEAVPVTTSVASFEERMQQLEAQFAAFQQADAPVNAESAAYGDPAACGWGHVGHRGCGWSAAVGFYYFQNRSHRPVATALTATGSTAIDFSDNDDLAPRLELQRVWDGGLGLRGRYWTIDQDSAENVALPGGALVSLANTALAAVLVPPGGAAALTRSVSVDVIDLEYTQDIDFGFASLVFSGGVRYARLEDHRTIQGTLLGVGSAVADSRLEGVGPVVGYEFRRPLDYWCVSLYHSLRFAFLFADLQTSSVTRDAGGAITTTSTADIESYFPMGEIELGVEKSNLFGTNAFVRAACTAVVYDETALLGFGLLTGVQY